MDNDEYTIDISSIDLGGTVTISSDMISPSTITWDDSWVTNDGTIDLDSLNITLDNPVEFEDYMPDVAKVEDMCNDYPALRKAYENFKTIYAMVHQDWQGRQDAENDLPF